ncbi:MAG: sugar phosphate isomerase/epimerase [Anaerolineae bacterium]|nr:sugar phosphate isomerase/epimerase [Anaerolineae bacterium]
MWDVALSTMWGIGRFDRLEDFFSAGQHLGFRQFELNHGVNSAMLNGVNLKRYRIVSVHEPCPADISTSTLSDRNWLISSPDEDERRQGVVAVRRSIDLAHEVGAQVVVVHPGRVDIDPMLETTLRDLYKAGRSNSPEYAEAKERLVAARAAQAEINLQAVRRSLGELAEYAGRLGIQLGLENRDHYYEIPLPDELDDLLDLGCDEVVGYCHDVGHAQKLEHLGFCPHEEWLRRFAGRMVGVHLHDIVGLRDHQVSGLGQVDWGMVARYLPTEAVRVCECRSYNSPQELAAGMRLLAEKGCVSKGEP